MRIKTDIAPVLPVGLGSIGKRCRMDTTYREPITLQGGMTETAIHNAFPVMCL